MQRADADSKAVTYHIKVDKSIKSGKDFYVVLNALLGNYFMWREQRYIKALRDLGWNITAIAQKLGYSHQYISIILSKSSSLHLVESENGKAPADERAIALPSSLSTNKSTTDDAEAGQTDVVGGQLNHQESGSGRVSGEILQLSSHFFAERRTRTHGGGTGGADDLPPNTYAQKYDWPQVPYIANLVVH